MKEQENSVWTALDGPWYYLGREVAGGFEVATLQAGAKPAPSNPADSRRHPVNWTDDIEQSRLSAASGNGRQLPLAIAFTTEADASPFIAAAPAGVKLLAVAADDQRAKEEWLRAVLEQGVRTIAFDIEPGNVDISLEAAATLPVRTALGYILSQRRATACL